VLDIGQFLAESPVEPGGGRGTASVVRLVNIFGFFIERTKGQEMVGRLISMRGATLPTGRDVDDSLGTCNRSLRPAAPDAPQQARRLACDPDLPVCALFLYLGIGTAWGATLFAYRQ
jgi:hypothetical protein